MAVGRGRPRKRTVKYPAHIDASKLPNYCYWDDSGNGHWYTVIREDGKSRRQKIADVTATLADLHKAIEEKNGVFVNTVTWLADEFEKSPQFKGVSKSTQKDYQYCRNVVCNHPTRKSGVTLGQSPRVDWNPPLVQKLVDQIAESRGPTAAKHVHGYIKRLFNWGINRGYCQTNPCQAIELPKERKRRRLPEKTIVAKLVTFAQERGQRTPRTRGACPPYIWIALEISFLCRLRGIEVFTLTDAQLLEEGVYCARRKGSDANITEWNDRLHNAVNAAQEARDAIWSKRRRPVPMKAEDRPVLVNTAGEVIKPYAWQNAWKRFMTLAIKEGIIEESERFGLHDMKRRGATDTKGTKAEKMEATGHKTRSQLDVYDLSVPKVQPTEE